MAASYVGLLHAEAEGTLESTVQAVLTHASNCSAKGYAHPVLINAVRYYQCELNAAMGKIPITPERATLSASASDLSAAWLQLGASAYWAKLIDGNHGAGLSYVERLFQPLGLDLGTRTFERFEGRGVKKIANASGVSRAHLADLASLRGRAMHVRQRDFQVSVRSMTPLAIRGSGQRATEAVARIVTTVANRLW